MINRVLAILLTKVIVWISELLLEVVTSLLTSLTHGRRAFRTGYCRWWAGVLSRVLQIVGRSFMYVYIVCTYMYIHPLSIQSLLAFPLPTSTGRQLILVIQIV